MLSFGEEAKTNKAIGKKGDLECENHYCHYCRRKEEVRKVISDAKKHSAKETEERNKRGCCVQMVSAPKSVMNSTTDEYSEEIFVTSLKRKHPA